MVPGIQHSKRVKIMLKNIFTLPLVAAPLLLVGCASAPQTLYQWDGYQSSVYQHFQTDNNLDAQVAVLEKSLEKAKASDRRVAPGVHAHLGLLYANSGREQQALEQFAIEKSLFPESAIFMDFLLKQNKVAL